MDRCKVIDNAFNRAHYKDIIGKVFISAPAYAQVKEALYDTQKKQNKKLQKVHCPQCAAKIWDVITVDQRLNKCWNCGLSFDNQE